MQGVGNGPSRRCSESQHDSSTLSVLGDTIESGRPQSVPVAKMPTATREPARSRVLGRANSVRRLFLGPTREDGDRLEHFAHQMGLPHSIVVKHVQVMRKQPIGKIPGLRPRCSPARTTLCANEIIHSSNGNAAERTARGGIILRFGSINDAVAWSERGM